MNFTGLLVGLSTFLIIGLFHPLVIKAEYYLGVKSWWIFALSGVIFHPVTHCGQYDLVHNFGRYGILLFLEHFGGI